mmetsp:Transcript_3012/g.5470  ORF Transcript_3012/g.5470 Transcript_3012/m.5470 type:complete len:86 (-) Transcript_3012:135-392(-)
MKLQIVEFPVTRRLIIFDPKKRGSPHLLRSLVELVMMSPQLRISEAFLGWPQSGTQSSSGHLLLLVTTQSLKIPSIGAILKIPIL